MFNERQAKTYHFRKRQLVFKAKSALKGKNVTTIENLTKIRQAIDKDAIVKFS